MRPGRDEYFMELAKKVAIKGTAGLIVVRDNNFIAAAYEGDGFSLEEGLFLYCAREGISIKGSTIYSTKGVDMKILSAAGVVKVITNV